MLTQAHKKHLAAIGLVGKQVLYKQAKEAYYNSVTGKPIMSDEAFDYLEELIRSEAPSWSGLKKTGIKVGKKVEVQLDLPMPSLDKIQHDNPAALARYVKNVAEYGDQYRVIVTPKYDGSSLQCTYLKGVPKCLRTRGDGTLGKDISYFLPYLTKQLPELIPTAERCVYRFEAVIKHSTWAKYYADEFDSARAMASAVFNRQDVHRSLSSGHMELKMLRVLEHGGFEDMTYRQGLDQARAEGFNVVPVLARIPYNKLTVDSVGAVLAKALEDAEYRCDGVVLMSNAPGLPLEAERPSYAKAFKNNSASMVRKTRIEEVIWTVHQGGHIIPKARVTPVDFDGIEVEYAALHNAKRATEHKHGVGAIVEIIRSGEIIPKITKVIKGAEFKLPAKSAFGEYEWDGVHIKLCDTHQRADVNAKLFRSTLRVLGIEHLAGKTATKIAEAGCPSSMALIRGLYTKGVPMLVHCGVSPVMAKKAIATLPATLTMPQLMEASNVFDIGMGSSRFTKLVETVDHPWYSMSMAPPPAAEVIGALGKVFGAKYLKDHKSFMKQARALMPYLAPPAKTKKAKPTSNKLAGQVVSFTGYRDEDHERAVELAGGTVAGFSAKTTILLYREGGKESSKVEKAREAGKRVCQFHQLKL